MVLGKQRSSSRSETGQMLLVVILVVIITLTIGLSLASRSITNLRSSTEEAESQKALAAAEAGIERAIQSNTSIATPVALTNNATYTTDVVPVSGVTFLLNGGNPISKNEGIDVWLQGHLANGTLDPSSFVAPSNPMYLYWGSAAENCAVTTAMPAAIQIIIVATDSSGTAKTYRYAYDPCSSTTRLNYFTTATTGTYSVAGYNFTYRASLDLSGIPIAAPPTNYGIVFMRVIPIYKDAIAAISNGNALPSQGSQIESTGKFGEANRKIKVFKGWPQTYLPYISYGLFVASN